MSNTESKLIVRNMTAADIEGVEDVHRNCFPATLSIFSVLDRKVVIKYYSGFANEPENLGAVLEDTETGRIAGFAVGTLKPGFQKRFIKRNLFPFSVAVIKSFFASKTIRRSTAIQIKKMAIRIFSRKAVTAEEIKIPDPPGAEGIFMPIAIHSDYRGGGNAARLAEYFTKSFFDLGIARVRGKIAPDNIASLKLFRKLGWKELETPQGWYIVWIDKPE